MLVLLIIGCTGGDPCEGVGDAEPSLEIGEGPYAFGPIEDGGTMLAEFGPQGGFHIWPAVRTTGFAPGRGGGSLGGHRDAPTFVATLRDEGVPLETVTTTLPMRGTAAEAELVLFRLPIPLDDGGVLKGERAVSLEIDGDDVCGTHVEGAVSVFVDAGYY